MHIDSIALKVVEWNEPTSINILNPFLSFFLFFVRFFTFPRLEVHKFIHYMCVYVCSVYVCMCACVCT